MRAIDADELKKCVLKWLPQDPCGKEEKEMPFETDICVSMLMEIDEQPTIQPEQPKRGRWLKNKTTWTGYTCSVCGDVPYMQTCMGKPKYDYCPFCGADMRQREE